MLSVYMSKLTPQKFWSPSPKRGRDGSKRLKKTFQKQKVIKQKVLQTESYQSIWDFLTPKLQKGSKWPPKAKILKTKDLAKEKLSVFIINPQETFRNPPLPQK